MGSGEWPFGRRLARRRGRQPARILAHARRERQPPHRRDRCRRVDPSRRNRQGRDLDRRRLPRPHAGAVRAARALRRRRQGDGRPARRPAPHDRGHGIALGQAFLQALGDKKGIARYADVHLPMDETLSRVALDLSGRAFLVFNADFPSQKIGAFDTELVREWFQAFAMNAGVTLHARRRCTATTAIISPRACSRVWPAPARRSGGLARRAAFPPRRVRSDWFSGGASSTSTATSHERLHPVNLHPVNTCTP